MTSLLVAKFHTGSVCSCVYFFLAEGLAKGLLNDEMILQGSDGTIASVNAAGWRVFYSF